MAENRLLAVISAMILFFPGNSANAAFTLNELQTIERLIVSQDCAALWSHLRANPKLVTGDDPLASELRNFSNGINGGLVQCLSDQPGAGTGAATDLGPAY